MFFLIYLGARYLYKIIEFFLKTECNFLRTNLSFAQKGNENQHADFTATTKILVNHIQMFSFLRVLDFRWETFMQVFLYFQAYFGDISESSTAFDCLFESEI